MLRIEGLNDTNRQNDRPVGEAGRSATRIITQLTAGLQNPNRVNVFVDGKFTLSLDVSQVIDFGVKVGEKLSEERLQELQRASEFGKLYQRALEWALTRPHSVRETRDYLKRRQQKRAQTNRKRISDELKPYPEIKDAVIKLVLERLQERGYIDDRKFAEYFVENRFTKKGVSRKRLELELRKKGVAEEIIESALTESVRDERTELEKMIQKKWRRYDKVKLISYLVRQGFRYDDAKEAVEQKYADNDTELLD